MKNTAADNLLNYDRKGLEALFIDMGEQRFRAAQALKWIYTERQLDVDQFSNFSKSLRNKIKANFRLELPDLINEQKSADGTVKWLIKVDEVNAVETVYIPEKNRGTLCVSSQVGCTLNCTFCATGAQGFNRHLNTAEIIAQVWIAAKQLNHHNKNRRITNIVMMGMGEPLANYNNVLPALNLMRDDLAFGFANKRVTVSTAGLVPKIEQLNRDADVSLAISLHAPFDSLRNRLIPLNRKYGIEELLKACKNFVKDKKKTLVTFEYILIKKINDQPEHARALVTLLSQIPSKINLIPFNPFPGSPFEKSMNNDIETFKQICMKAGFITTVRKTRGDDIDAACGQLAGEFMDRTRRSTQTNKIAQKLALEVC